MTVPEDPTLRQITVTVNDFMGVARVVGLLRGRQYEPVVLNASAQEGHWTVIMTVDCGAAAMSLLCHRLNRLVEVNSLRRAG